MVRGRLQTRPARDHSEVAAFFDRCAPTYADQHGDGERQLRYRLSLLRAAAGFTPEDVVLEVGCGTGMHLLGLAGEYRRGVGVDLSPMMVEVARARCAPHHEHLDFTVDRAEQLRAVADRSVDVVLMIGALEHVIDQAAACRSVWRVLRPGGRFVCLTLNGGSLWYRWLAPALGIHTRQLATDRYLSAGRLAGLLRAAGFPPRATTIDCWTFVQRGDLPRPLASLLTALDRAGRLLHLGVLRGGLRLRAIRP